MHDKRIIHRDIKPSNVFVMEDGSLKLGDLGLGRYLDLQSILAFSQVGTPLYMAPEILRGEGHHFASDIWSLGCLLYELATLKSPFQEKGLTMDRLFVKIVKGEYSKEGYSSGRVSRVVESMLNTEAKQRPDIHWVTHSPLNFTKLHVFLSSFFLMCTYCFFSSNTGSLSFDKISTHLLMYVNNKKRWLIHH
jgi:serine/threonine protein kinase